MLGFSVCNHLSISEAFLESNHMLDFQDNFLSVSLSSSGVKRLAEWCNNNVKKPCPLRNNIYTQNQMYKVCDHILKTK